MSSMDKPRRRVFGVTAVIVALMAVAMPAPALATPTSTIRDWNLYAVQVLANATNGSPKGAAQAPPVSMVHLAMAQAAVYDAVNAIDGTHQAYLSDLSAASGASIDAAAAQAAHDVLVGLLPQFPNTSPPAPAAPFNDAVRAEIRAYLDSRLAATLSTVPDGPGETAGVNVGAAAAAAMLDDRTADDGRPADGRYGPFRFTSAFGVGQWRAGPTGSDPNAWLAFVRPFTFSDPSTFRSDGPLDITSDAYTAEFNEVKALGRRELSSRTPEQTDLGLFHSANPVPMFNTTFRNVAGREELALPDQARLFAMLSMAGADAAISCWNDKAYWSFWRPSTAIENAEADGNPDTSTDPGWAPVIPNPPYPDQPSGYNCLTGAIMHTAQNFFGTDKMAFTLTTGATAAVDRERDYTRFSTVFKDTIDARLYLGIHFRTPNVHGVVMGKKVAQWLDKHFFGPAS